MDESLEIKSAEAEEFDRRYCIICQKKNTKGLTSTANGRSKMEAARIREDEVWDRLQSPNIAEEFLYHMDNKCYKMYVLKKTLENIKVTNNFCFRVTSELLFL